MVVPIRVVVGSSTDPGLGDRWALQVFLVARRGFTSLQCRFVGAGSHPEGEPPVGSAGLFCLEEGPALEPVVGPAHYLPTGLQHPPCPPPLLLLL